MTRINLLPPEILEKRRGERRVVYIVFGLLGMIALLGAVWLFLTIQVQSRESEKASKEQQAANLRVQAEHFKIFEDKQNDLRAREAVADTALANRVNWSKLFTELSLVLPADVWLENMSADQAQGLTLAGWATDSDTDSPDVGHKAVAKVLVRLNDIRELSNVWLTSSRKAAFRQQDAISWTVSASVKGSASEPTAAAPVPGPPSGAPTNTP